MGTYQVVHTLDYPGAILSVGVSVSCCLSYLAHKNDCVTFTAISKYSVPSSIPVADYSNLECGKLY